MFDGWIKPFSELMWRCSENSPGSEYFFLAVLEMIFKYEHIYLRQMHSLHGLSFMLMSSLPHNSRSPTSRGRGRNRPQKYNIARSGHFLEQ